MPLPWSAGEKLYAEDLNELGPLGAWDNSSYSAETVYQADTDGFLLVYGGYANDWWSITVYVDTFNPPTTVRAYTYNNQGYQQTLTVPIKKGTYFKVVCWRAGATINWIPIGS